MLLVWVRNAQSKATMLLKYEVSDVDVALVDRFYRNMLIVKE